jgi:hypothetical protein
MQAARVRSHVQHDESVWRRRRLSLAGLHRRKVPAARVLTPVPGRQRVRLSDGLRIASVFHGGSVRGSDVRRYGNGLQRWEPVRGQRGLRVSGVRPGDVPRARVRPDVRERRPVWGQHGLYVEPVHERCVHVSGARNPNSFPACLPPDRTRSLGGSDSEARTQTQLADGS